ncbi:MAG TPA: HAMP domain-containing sensor histidine kinase [Flavobacterium sp.]|nr:HAMP domain-containing sensor histidine kinase [Flavobacterium sp.]
MVSFQKRKVIHKALLLSVILLQIFLLVILYNEIINEKKLRALAENIELSNQVYAISDEAKDNYINAQFNLQKYIQSKDILFLDKYNTSLKKLNLNFNKLRQVTNQNELFSLYLDKSDFSDITFQKINAQIDSISKVDIAPSLLEEKTVYPINNFTYDKVLDSIQIENNSVIDSVQQKKLFGRIGDAITGKVAVQKERENVVITLHQGKNVFTGTIEEQLKHMLALTNQYYQENFKKYKNKLVQLNRKDTDFVNQNTQLLNLSYHLFNDFKTALDQFALDTQLQYNNQEYTNRTIRFYTAICVIILMIIITIILTQFTRLAYFYEKRFRNLNKEIQKNLNFKNRIVGMISHEIRSPLNIISIYSKHLSKKYEDEELKEGLQSINFSANSLSLLANQILDFSKSEHVENSLKMSAFALRNEFEEILKTLETFVDDNGNKLMTQNDISNEIWVNADAAKIHRLLYNLIGNANKFTEKGTIEVSLQSSLITNNQLRVDISVKDSGIGIAAEDLENIFENYKQGNKLTKIKNLGVGLGLNLCKEIVDLYHGNIKIASEKDQGTIIELFILLEKIEGKND